MTATEEAICVKRPVEIIRVKQFVEIETTATRGSDPCLCQAIETKRRESEKWTVSVSSN